MKIAAKYVLTLCAFVLVAYGLSWAAVYSFWFMAFWFHSVAAVRIGEAVGSVILIPVRVLFYFMGDMVDQSTPLYDPRAEADRDISALRRTSSTVPRKSNSTVSLVSLSKIKMSSDCPSSIACFTALATSTSEPEAIRFAPLNALQVKTRGSSVSKESVLVVMTLFLPG